MFLSRRSLRHIAQMMLAVWMFAVGAGVANACRLNTPDEHHHAPLQAAMVSTPVALAHGHAPPDPGAASCLRFCEEPALAIQKLHLPILDGEAVADMVLRAWAPFVLPSANQRSASAHQTVWQAQPIAARPHRLTL